MTPSSTFDTNNSSATSFADNKTQNKGAFPFFMATSSTETNKEEKENCNNHVRNGLVHNVTIRFLMERLVDLGCEPPKGFIRCIDCGKDNTQAGAGFGMVEEITKEQQNKNRNCNNDTTKLQRVQQLLQEQKDTNNQDMKLRLLPEIFLCQQQIVHEKHCHQSLVHELIHAIDLCRTKMDPINNCIHMACAEIRAENLSGECGAMQELLNGRITKFPGHGAECVKRRAILSVQANPNCKAKAKDYVDAAFEKCFQDTFPFDRHPNLR